MLLRKMRCPEEGENVVVMIFSIVRATAKESEKQYTKRILPPFVIPFCQISREGVMGYLGRLPDGRFKYGVG